MNLSLSLLSHLTKGFRISHQKNRKTSGKCHHFLCNTNGVIKSQLL